MNNLDIAVKYCNDVINDVIPNCDFIKKQCAIFLKLIVDSEDNEYYYNPIPVDERVNFIQSFYLTERDAQELTILQPFQIFWLAGVFGIFNKKNNNRKHRIIYAEVGRGNAKTQIICLLSIFELIYGYDAQCIYAGNTNKTTMEVGFDKILKLINQIDPPDIKKRRKFFKVLYNKIIYKNNKLITSSNEASAIDGLSGSLMCADEAHLFNKPNVLQAMKSSMAKRPNSILFLITTAGADINSECYRMREYAINVLSGFYNDPSLFTLIYTVNPEQIKDIGKSDNAADDDKFIQMANPNLGISIQTDVIQNELLKAKQNPIEKASIYQKHLNIWLKNNNEKAFIEEKYVDACMKKISIDDEIFKDLECYCGVDMAENRDISAVVYMFVINDIYYFFPVYYLCEDNTNSSITKAYLRQAAQFNYLHITSGNVTDYDRILADVVRVNESHTITKIFIDKFNALQFIIDATEQGFAIEPFSQLGGSMNAPLKQLERLMLTGDKVVIQFNSITRWMFENAIVEPNKEGNYFLKKSNKNFKVDGISAICDALGGYLKSPQFGFGIY
jgi:phage terminase large subunit-like protein